MFFGTLYDKLSFILSLYISPFFAVSVIIVGLADSFLIFFDLFTDHIHIGITLINSSSNGITRIYKSNTHIKINVAKIKTAHDNAGTACRKVSLPLKN